MAKPNGKRMTIPSIEIAERARQFEVTHIPARKWCVLQRDKDRTPVQENLANQKAAEEWLLEHVTKLLDGEPPKEAAPRRVPNVPRDLFRLREGVNNAWALTAPAGLTLEDLDAPSTWTANGQYFLPFDLVYVVAYDQSWWAEVLIVAAGVRRVQVLVLRKQELEIESIASGVGGRVPPGHRIRKGSLDEGWIVEREDKTSESGWQIMGKASERGWVDDEDALRWLLDHASIRQAVASRPTF